MSRAMHGSRSNWNKLQHKYVELTIVNSEICADQPATLYLVYTCPIHYHQLSNSKSNISISFLLLSSLAGYQQTSIYSKTHLMRLASSRHFSTDKEACQISSQRHCDKLTTKRTLSTKTAHPPDSPWSLQPHFLRGTLEKLSQQCFHADHRKTQQSCPTPLPSLWTVCWPNRKPSSDPLQLHGVLQDLLHDRVDGRKFFALSLTYRLHVGLHCTTHKDEALLFGRVLVQPFWIAAARPRRSLRKIVLATSAATSNALHYNQRCIKFLLALLFNVRTTVGYKLGMATELFPKYHRIFLLCL